MNLQNRRCLRSSLKLPLHAKPNFAQTVVVTGHETVHRNTLSPRRRCYRDSSSVEAAMREHFPQRLGRGPLTPSQRGVCA